MAQPDIRSWITHIQEAYEGEIPLKQTVTRNLTQYGAEAERMQRAGSSPPTDYAQLKTAADLMRILHTYVDELSQSDALTQSPAMVLLSKLKSQRVDQTAQQLDGIAKLPAPQDEK
jgi:hypothetical protein